ncbi:MAG: heme lyase CcmF/NrfE family subunit [Wolbachia endosymbiont of Fragariocoptes setiger]|nr:heme lyase CcmF/NrfE family subunit [Wolbachia endosymbiont of Fragariocoptes setiger]
MYLTELANILLLVACFLSFSSLFYLHRYTVFLIFLFTFTPMTILIYCHITNDFSLENVYYYSHTTKPLLYKICGVWGNKEGSMLLWTLILTFYLLLVNIFLYNKKLKRISIITQSLICFCFLVFTIFQSNPFTKMSNVFSNGLGFNPILQDIGLAIHPPILYLGYLGFSVVFSLSIAALITKTEGNDWAKIIRPWLLISWSLLTIGISLGSWWAYRELGWGGFWFWDPVENVSLLPWLIAATLSHLLIIVRNFNVLRNFSILLALGTFIFSIISTFIVRSGILSSVHTFANDPVHGLYLLFLLGVITGTSTIIFIIFTKKSHLPKLSFPLSSRFIMILANNLFFIIGFFIILIGTLYPTLLEYFSGKIISVGEPYYNTLFNSIALATLALTIVGQYSCWKGGNLLYLLRDHRFSFCSSAAVLPFIFHMKIIIVLSIIISVALIVFVIEAYSKKILLFRSSIIDSILLAKQLSKSYYAMMISHAGIGVLVLGVTCAVGWQEEKEGYLKVGDSIVVNKFQITLQNVELVKKENFQAIKGTISIRNMFNNKIIGNIYPEYRFYLVEGQRNVESSIYHNFFSDIYVVIGEINKAKNSITATVYYKPAISLIWLGCTFIAFGSLLAAFPMMKRVRRKTLLS